MENIFEEELQHPDAFGYIASQESTQIEAFALVSGVPELQAADRKPHLENTHLEADCVTWMLRMESEEASKGTVVANVEVESQNSGLEQQETAIGE